MMKKKITLKQQIQNKKKVRLSEIGPRLTMQLIKIEEKVFEGDIHYHKFVNKTEEEKEESRNRKIEKELLKAQRKAEQERNIEKKKAKMEIETQEIYGTKVYSDDDSVSMDDADWYRKEVGREPERDTFSK